MEAKEYYIYALLNDAGLIKIGITQNFDNRLQSLSGSNGGGHKIIDYYVSPMTYLFTLENHFHEKYAANRIENTEWFEELDFEEVSQSIEQVFTTESYKLCNQVRKEFEEKYPSVPRSRNTNGDNFEYNDPEFDREERE